MRSARPSPSAGAPSRPWETPAEFARRAASTAPLPNRHKTALVGLAGSLEEAAYSPSGPDEAAATAAQASADQIRAETGAPTARPWRRRLAAMLDPRPVWRRGVNPGA